MINIYPRMESEVFTWVDGNGHYCTPQCAPRPGHAIRNNTLDCSSYTLASNDAKDRAMRASSSRRRRKSERILDFSFFPFIHLSSPFPFLLHLLPSKSSRRDRGNLVLASSSLAGLELLEVPAADLHVALLLVHALGEGLRGALAVVAPLVLLLLRVGLRLGRRFGRCAAAAAAEEAADGVAD